MMRRCQTLAEVLANSDDQVAVRAILLTTLPLGWQRRIVAEFNCYVDHYNARRRKLDEAIAKIISEDLTPEERMEIIRSINSL